MGSRGRVVLALIGAGLVIQGATGLHLWWPFARRADRRFTVRWPRPWPIVSHDLHRAMGALSLAFNVPVALTGLALALAAPGWSRDAAADSRPGPVPDRAHVSVDAVARAADRALPGGRLTSIRFGPGRIEVRMRMPGDLDPRGTGSAVVDARTGVVLHASDGGGIGARLWGHVATLHSGDFGGMASKVMWAAGALVSAVVVFTGFSSWLARPSMPP
jgi:uncharacterized iron-regulated membrane protein